MITPVIDPLKKLESFLSETGMRIYSSSSVWNSERAGSKAKAQTCWTPKPTYDTRVHALADVEKVPMPPKTEILGDREEGHFLDIYADKKYRLKGNLALSRLCHISPKRYGRKSVTLFYAVTPSRIQVVTTLNQLERHIRGGSQQAKLASRTNLRQQICASKPLRYFDNINRNHNERFIVGVTKFHLAGYILYKWSCVEFPQHAIEVGNLFASLVADMLREGRWRTDRNVTFLESLESIHQEGDENPFSTWLKNLPEQLKIAIYRSRKCMFKDEPYGIPLLLECLKRRTSLPIQLSPEALEILKEFHKSLDVFLGKNLHMKAFSRKYDLGKSSGSLLYTRAEGGGSREAHLMIGLYRLSKGEETSLDRVFGTPESSPDLQGLMHLFNNIDIDEVEQATLYCMELVRKEIIPKGIIWAIYPERESKARTFMLEPSLPEMIVRPALKILKAFLSQTNQGSEVMGGDCSFEPLCAAAASIPDNIRVDEDSSVATDFFPLQLPKIILAPILDFLDNDIIRRAMDFHCSECKTGVALDRPRIKIDLLSSRSKIRFSFEKPKNASPFFKQNHKGFALDERRCLAICEKMNLRIRKHLPKIIGFAARGPCIIKGGTGSGKTLLLANQPGVILVVPTIEQITLISHSLSVAEIDHRMRFTGIPNPPRGYLGCILCTAPYAYKLYKQNTARFVVSDEGESPFETIQLNYLKFLKQGVPFLITSATPEALNLDLQVVECPTERVFSIFEEKPISVNFLNQDIQARDFSKVLIITYSEPHAFFLARILQKSYEVGLGVASLSPEEILTEYSKPVIVTTNRIRSGVTIEGLDAVYDLQRRYVFITDPKTGLIVPVLCEVKDSDKEQAKGRVGRVKDGFYIPVETNLSYSPPWDKLSDCSEAVLYAEQFDLRTLPILPDFPSWQKRTSDLYFLASALGETGRTPTALRNQKSPYLSFVDSYNLGSASRQSLKLWVLASQFNVQQTIRELGRSTDSLVAELSQSFEKALQEGRVLRGTYEALRDLKALSISKRLVNMVENGLGKDMEDLETICVSDLNDPDASEGFCLLNWQQITEVTGGYLRGVFRDFIITTALSDVGNFAEGQLVLPVGLQYVLKTSTLTYSRLIEVPFEPRRIFKQAVDLYSQFGNQDPCFEKHYVFCRGRDQKSRLVYENGDPPIENAQPEQLQTILDRLKLAVDEILQPIDEDGQKLTTLTRGVNMASEISMPTLVSTCVACAMRTETLTGGTVSVFGDDVAAVFPPEVENPAEAVDFPRRQFGLLPKKQATGVQRRMDSITVFTERFFDGSGNELEGPKPGSIIRLLLASQTGRFIGREEDNEDFEGICRKIKTAFPTLASSCKLNTSVKFVKKRVTSSRTLAHRILNALDHEGGRILDWQAGQAVAALEERILWLLPSTRGTPERVPLYEANQNTKPFVTEGQVRQLQSALGIAVEDVLF